MKRIILNINIYDLVFILAKGDIVPAKSKVEGRKSKSTKKQVKEFL